MVPDVVPDVADAADADVLDGLVALEVVLLALGVTVPVEVLSVGVAVGAVVGDVGEILVVGITGVVGRVVLGLVEPVGVPAELVAVEVEDEPVELEPVELEPVLSVQDDVRRVEVPVLGIFVVVPGGSTVSDSGCVLLGPDEPGDSDPLIAGMACNPSGESSITLRATAPAPEMTAIVSTAPASTGGRSSSGRIPRCFPTWVISVSLLPRWVSPQMISSVTIGK